MKNGSVKIQDGCFNLSEDQLWNVLCTKQMLQNKHVSSIILNVFGHWSARDNVWTNVAPNCKG